MHQISIIFCTPSSIITKFLILVILNFLFLNCALELCYSKSITCGIVKPIHIDNQIAVTERYGKSFRGQIKGVTVLVLRGSYEERGEAHGALVGKQIIQLLDQTLISYINQKQPNAWVDVVLPLTRSYRFSQQYERMLLAMIRGIKKTLTDKQDRMLISIGRPIGVDDLRALNCVSDIMGEVDGGCSSFSAWGSLTENGQVISARNLDYRAFPGEIPIIVVAQEPAEVDLQATIEIGTAGYIGASTAMNADGLMLMMHYEKGLQARSENNYLPRALIVRDALEKVRATDPVKQIARILKNRPVRIGNNTHVTFPLQDLLYGPFPVVMEWDGNEREDGVTIRYPDNTVVSDAIICTNHYVKRREEKKGEWENSQKRFELLKNTLRRLHISNAVIDVNKAKAIMHSVARHGETVTYLTVVALPKDRKIVFSVTPKRGVPATRGEWIEITWNSVFGIE